jgi:hypothetical protein
VMLGGAGGDRRVTQELLRVLAPVGWQASVEAMERRKQREPAQRHPLAYTLEQLPYDAQRALDQYPEVDPRARLGAAELERRWNANRAEVEEVQATLVALWQHPPTWTADEGATLLRLGERFAEVGDRPPWPRAGRKTLIGPVVPAVLGTAAAAAGTWRFVMPGHGGSHTRFERPTPPWGRADQPAPANIALIRQLAVRSSAEEIPRVLHRQGRPTGTGHRWTQNRVAAARRRAVLNGQRRPRPDPEVFSRQPAARDCGVSSPPSKRLVASGVLNRAQGAPWAPWEIKRTD